ncbi:M20 family metallopeptidase [Capillimicrobium parvum]|uniref:N-formyl-4-amino-5-aminomethyl-2-methylpyrimidine deformylase n=1 Tax=Capillimicrobium parvum TaxID=2884022 RepID=A0A9E6Y169_9ACTN|nr:M20 family metallopeptidase [Capillimicrobium parvum]UGS38312.1 N-formyl-4-amino-5-aminomethyl-2-methylpyrimidine deformylase [Capillimicrobium parvum]
MSSLSEGIDLATPEGALSDAFLQDVLRSLVQTRSVNPGIYETQMAEMVRRWLEPTGADVHVVEFAPGRPSVAAVMAGSGGGPTLVLNGHMDTVPIDDESLWDSDPFAGDVRNGYMYGRGACDMKAGLTTQIAVAHRLASIRDELKGTLILHFVAGEECAEPGALSLVQAGFTGDFGIVTEPTELRVAVAERGLGLYRVRILGQSIHASRATLGINPVPRLRGVLQVIDDYEREVMAKPHPLLPGGSCTPTVVRAGVKENAVADYCDLLLDRRLIPGETIEGERAELERRLSALGDDDPDFSCEVTSFEFGFEPAEIPADSKFAAIVADAVKGVTGTRGEIWGTPYASDVRNLVNDAGMEAVTFGPGNVAECHCANERVSMAQVRQAAEVMARVARDLL